MEEKNKQAEEWNEQDWRQVLLLDLIFLQSIEQLQVWELNEKLFHIHTSKSSCTASKQEGNTFSKPPIKKITLLP